MFLRSLAHTSSWSIPSISSIARPASKFCSSTDDARSATLFLPQDSTSTPVETMEEVDVPSQSTNGGSEYVGEGLEGGESMNEVRSRIPLTGTKCLGMVLQGESPATVEMQHQQKRKTVEGKVASERKRAENNKQFLQSSDDLRQRLSAAITTHHWSTEIAVLHIMKRFNFHLSQLEQILSEEGLQVSFSNVKYKQIAPFVGLDYLKRFSDTKTFKLHRSRIPTPLLKSIVQDLDVMLVQYGPLPDHQTEETRSRFLSPIFNNLVAQFGFTLRNEPESVIQDHIITRGRIAYCFKAFGAVVILCIEIKLEIGDKDGRLNAIAQVIAECDACDWNNSQANFFGVSIYGILCDGITFEFFLFDGSKQPSNFFRGCFPGDPKRFRRGLRLSDFTLMEKTTQFICDLRPICESIFDIMLAAYISCLTAYQHRSFNRGIKQGKPRKSLDKWNMAVQRAEEALRQSREADLMRQASDFDNADTMAQTAINTLKLSIGLIPEPIFYETPLIMSGWDDEAIQRT